MLKICLLIFAIILACPASGQVQKYPLTNLTVKDGLPSNTVYQIYPDHNSYLWMATDKGVARYNGRKLELFTTFDGLPDNEILQFLEDFSGRLWLSSFSGNLCFFKDGIFHTAKNTPWLKLRKTISSNPLGIEPDSSITFLSIGGRSFINIKNNTVSEFSLEKVRERGEITGNSIIYLRKKASNRYELYVNTKVLVIDTFQNILSERAYSANDKYWTVASNKGLALGNNKGIYTISEQLEYPLKNIDFPDRFYYFKDKNHTFLCSKKGVIVDQKEKILEGVYTNFILNHSGYYWISSRENGIFLLNEHFSETREWDNAYPGKIVKAELKNGGLFFISNNGDLGSIINNRSKILFENKTMREEDFSSTQFFLTANSGYLSLSFKKNYSVLKAPNGRQYTYNQIPSFWNAEGEGIKEILSDKKYLYIVTIASIIRIAHKSLETGNFADRKTLVKSDGINSRIYSRALNSNDNSIWFSRSDGLYKVSDTLIKEQINFKNFTFRKLSFFQDYLIALTDDNKLIIGTLEGQGSKVDSLSIDNCIWENIYSIDARHAIISTNNYYRLLTLHKPDAGGKPLYSLSAIEDDLVPQRAEYIVADSNNCYFFRDRKITRIATHILFNKTPPPAPLFSTVKTQRQSIPFRQEISITYDESKSINITFDNISFIGKQITSQYSISGNGEEEWHEISGNEINLNTPGYGTFTIKVRSKTLSSGYSKPAVLILNIQKPFWATWWFISLSVIAFILLVWCIVFMVTWRRLRKKQKEHDADMKYQQSEYKALNALMNPHFIFNSLNNIQGLINKDEKRTANQYLVIFSDLVRQNMHNISKGFISLQEELTLIENYLTLEKLRFKELVNYRITVEEDIDIEDILIPPLMIQPLVENAVKHGLLPRQSPSSMVAIHVYEKENVLYVMIEDNGIGLTESLKSQNRLHDSFGLANLQKRTEHLKKIQQHEISIDIIEVKEPDGTVTGTRAKVTIKLE